MKLAKEKVDLTWLNKEDYEVLLPIWEKESGHTDAWTTENNCYGFRRICYTEKGRGTSVQHIKFFARQNSQELMVEIHNPSTYNTSTALLPLTGITASPRQFQKLVFSLARGDQNTLSASKTNLRLVWKEFLEAIAKMPVVEHEELHLDNSEEGWLE